MQTSVEERDNAVIVALAGRFDAASASDVKKLLKGLIADGKCRLVLELSQVDFLDSSGLGVLVTCKRLADNGGGDLRLAGADSRIETILKMTRLNRVFEIDADVAVAISRLPGGKT
ncbi:MAG TPA: STAS domain-containing protein [Candidatus Brocadiia bacterium]|nr:STAS domain-containing protein [Candidatus Brocadiia bacterium]